jgi:hypothetical protein
MIHLTLLCLRGAFFSQGILGRLFPLSMNESALCWEQQHFMRAKLRLKSRVLMSQSRMVNLTT